MNGYVDAVGDIVPKYSYAEVCQKLSDKLLTPEATVWRAVTGALLISANDIERSRVVQLCKEAGIKCSNNDISNYECARRLKNEEWQDRSGFLAAAEAFRRAVEAGKVADGVTMPKVSWTKPDKRGRQSIDIGDI